MNPQGQAPLSGEQQRIAHTIEGLNARIARLAIGLGVSLKTNDDVARAMTRGAVVAVEYERRVTPERRTASRPGATADRRQSHQRDELRGLLVLRYDLETRCVDAVGITATRQILIEVEAHLARDGFPSSASGIDLNPLFNDK